MKRTQLRAWRERAGITLIEAGRAAGKSDAVISQMERGLLPYNQRVLEPLAKLYGCSPGDLIDRAPK
jgi:transcriptional regulator with XRE-family HTH domain